MKFFIQGKPYDLKNGIAKASLLSLFELKSRHGIGMKSIMESAKKMEKIDNPMDFLEDEKTFKTFLAVIWLARRYAGEKVTFEDANDFPLDSITVESEDGDAAVSTPDPKEPTVSAPAKPDHPPAMT